MLTFELPWPPSVNHYYQRRGRRVFLSHKGRQFRTRVQEILQAQEVTPMDGLLDMVVDLYPPDRRRRDCDNPIKSLLDALQHGGAYGDDSQIVKLTIAMHQPAPGGRTMVHIRNCQDKEQLHELRQAHN